MKKNLYLEISEELDYFVDKFVSIGYDQEDLHYLVRTTNYVINPESRNEEWKYQFGMVLYAELLSYTEDTKYMLTPWICGRITVNPEDVKDQKSSERLRFIAKTVQDDLKQLNIRAFFDEDAFLYNFSRPELNQRRDSVSIKFYINKDYPDGYWENHTLE